MEVTGTGSITVPADGTLSIASGGTLTVDSGASVTVGSGGTLTNNGTVTNSGTMTNNGTFNGTEPVGGGDKTGFKPKMTVSAPDVTKTYDGQAYGITVTVSTPTNGATIMFGESAGSCTQTASPTITNVSDGPRTIYFKVTDSTNTYADYTGSATVTINPKTVNNPTITLSQDTYTYDGSAKEPTPTVKDGTTEILSTEYTVGYSNNTNAGTATVTIKDNTGGNYTVSGSTTFTINRADLDPAPTVTMNGYAYGAAVPTPSVSGNTGNGAVTYYYSTTDSNTGGTKWENITGTTLAPNTYYMYAEIAQSTNYNAATTAVTSFIVSKGTQTISFVSATQEKTYGDADFTVTATGAKTSVSYQVTDGDAATVDSATGAVHIVKAGTATITATAAETDAYAAASTSYTLTINRKAVTVKADNKRMTVGGTVPELTKTVTGLVGSDQAGAITANLECQHEDKAGTYTIKVSGETIQGNYTVTYVDGALTISAKPSGGSTGGSSSGGSPSSGGSSSSGASSGTSTTTNPDGSTTRTTTNADGSRTAVTTAQDGCTATVKADRSGNVVSVAFSVSQKAAEEAQRTGAPIQLPAEIAPVTPQNAATAAVVAITVPNAFIGGGAARVEIEVTRSGPGVIAMLRGANGGLTPVKECYEGSVILPVTESCEIVIVDNTKQFSDVKANDWFYDNVTFVTAREIFNGTGDGLFTANASMTRGMLAQALYNFDRSAAPNDSYAFVDARGKWYAGAASWAASVGVVTGTDEGFEGEANVTREAVATMLYRYAKAQGNDVAARADLSAFADAASVSDWALEAMHWAVGTGLVNGMDGTLAPQAPATRAQLAAIIERFVENVVR